MRGAGRGPGRLCRLGSMGGPGSPTASAGQEERVTGSPSASARRPPSRRASTATIGAGDGPVGARPDKGARSSALRVGPLMSRPARL